jgi:NAD(P)H-hydrate epimerase
MQLMIRLTREQVRRIDRLAVEKYHIPGVVLMENAAIAAANVATEMVGNTANRFVVILCGGGNNGGDGLAVARHLHNRNCDVKIFVTSDPQKYSGEAKINWDIIQAMNLPIEPFSVESIGKQRPALMIDAIFGTGLTQPPREPFPEIVEAVQKLAAPILAIDIPSGLDCDTGKPLGRACIRANRTVTFVAEKAGFGNPEAKQYLGEVIVAGIGCPKELISQV